MKLLIEDCCCGLLDLTAPWIVVGAAGILDSAVEVPVKEVKYPAEEVLVVETAPAAAGPPSSTSVLTCANSKVGCEVFRCLLKFEVLPPLVENCFLADVAFCLSGRSCHKMSPNITPFSRAHHDLLRNNGG